MTACHGESAVQPVSQRMALVEAAETTNNGLHHQAAFERTMKKADLNVVKTVIAQSKLTNKMVAEAFGFKDTESLNVEFLDNFGMTLTEFRQRCKTQTPEEDSQTSQAG